MESTLIALALVLAMAAGVGIGHWWGNRATNGDAWVRVEGKPDGTVYLEIRDQHDPLAHITMTPGKAREVAARISTAANE